MNANKMSFNILTNCCEPSISTLPIAIIGAGPIGLAAAAHLSAKNEKFVIFESGHSVGFNILQWSHVRLFSSWNYNVDKVAVKLLENSAWKAPLMKRLPFGKELVED